MRNLGYLWACEACRDTFTSNPSPSPARCRVMQRSGTLYPGSIRRATPTRNYNPISVGKRRYSCNACNASLYGDNTFLYNFTIHGECESDCVEI